MGQQPDLIEEQRLQALGYRYIAGLDEAGRGTWAGPVVAAAVLLPLNRSDLAPALEGVRDSKQCTARQRDALYERIAEVALAVGVGSCSSERIDQIGIVSATREAMAQAVAGLSVSPEALLIDALSLPDLALPQLALPKGDARSLSIAAASIVAKVTRDRMMVELDARYNGYGFARHKGYGTAYHRQALACYGPSAAHRLSFAPLRKLCGQTDDPIRVLTYNIHHWHGADDRLDAARVTRTISQSRADIVGLNEVFHPLTAAGVIQDLLSRMAAQLGMAYAFGPTNPYSDWGYVAGPYGNALLSRYPMRGAATLFLPATEGHYRRAVLRTELDVGGETWTVYVTHLNHLSETVRDRETAALLQMVGQHGDGPHLLVGDFNSLAPADFCRCPHDLTRREAEFLGCEASRDQRDLLPLRVVPRLLQMGYTDAWIAAGSASRGETWPTPSPQVRIDYLFVPPVLRDRLLTCCVADSPVARMASDHLPVLAEFSPKSFDPSGKI